MPIRLNPDGTIEPDSPNPGLQSPGRSLDFILREPGGITPGGLRQRSLDAGTRANRLLYQAAAPFAGDPTRSAVVAPALLDIARQNPIGLAAQYLDRAVTTLISAVLAATNGSWSQDRTRLAFSAAFGLDPGSVGLRNALVGPMDPFPIPGGSDEGLPDNLRPILDGAAPIPNDGVLPDPLNDPQTFHPLDDIFNRTCLLGVFSALHQLGEALAGAPREDTAAYIDELAPNHGCKGDKITIRGHGFGATQAEGLELMFPAFKGGWVSVEVDPKDWSDKLIHAIAPDNVGTGPVGFIFVNPSMGMAVGPAVDNFIGEVGACLGPGAQLRAGSVFGKLGPMGNAGITPTRTNLFRGGPPIIDYFLGNGAQRVLIHPRSDLKLQWSAINADQVTMTVIGVAPPEQPAAPAGSLIAHGEVLFQNVPGVGGGWTGRYELTASNRCGQVKQQIEIDMRSRKALAFSGGGAKGAFEVGVARCLYDVFAYRPDLLVGASVGSLNAAKLAEGPAALPELEKLWNDMKEPSDFFLIRGQINTILQQMGPDMRQFLKLNPLEDLLGWTPEPTSTTVLNLNILGRAISWVNSGIGNAAGASTIFTVTDVLFTGIGLGLTIGKIVQAIQQLLNLPSLLLFDPVSDKIMANIDPAKVTASGIELRLVVNCVRNSKVRYVDGMGAFVDGGPAPGLLNAITASASIPIAFPPIRLSDGEDYVDGGVLENIPIEAAARAGADEIIAVLPSVAKLPDITGFPNQLIPVALRAVDMLLDGSTRRQLEPYRGWGVPVTVIAPRFELYNLLVVDPGLIQINMDYGYMCAFDEMQPNDALRSQYRASSDAIASARKEIWFQEHFANGVNPKGLLTSGQIQPTGSADEVLWIRQRKRDIRDMVVARIALTPGGGNVSVPAMIAKAWTDWEAHFFDTWFPTPWDGFGDYPGPLLQPETPPPQLP